MEYLIPFLIFIARVIDVSLGTIRIIAISREKKLLASIMGFFEVFVWILAIGQIFNNLNGFANYLGYALGYATGNYVGLILEQKVSMGVVVVRVFSRRAPKKRKKSPSGALPDPIEIITAPVPPTLPVEESNPNPEKKEPVPSESESIAKVLREAGFGVTRLNAQGEFGPVSILFTVVKRKNLNEVIGRVKAVNPVAFYTVEDIRAVDNEDIRLVHGSRMRPRMWWRSRGI